MTRGEVTEDLIFTLVTSSHATGVINLWVAAAVEYRGQVLLVASDDDELDPSFELPFAAVLPGEHLLDALWRCLAVFGLSVSSVTGYLGHYDGGNADDDARAFCFAVTVNDPHAVCRAARVGHEWADLEDPASFSSSAYSQLIELLTWPSLE
jgi:hypothetical protein